MDKKLDLSFYLSFCREMVPGSGEDSYCYSFGQEAGIIGVFDGCGGAGARKHQVYAGKTEAYMASRLCAGSFYNSFRSLYPCEGMDIREHLEGNALRLLRAAQPPQNTAGPQIRGSMIRTLPTTAAAALIRSEGGESVALSALWAGDSRVYLLDENGLAQLTMDDTTIPDPMENLYDDGLLRNVFCTDRKVRLHCSDLRLYRPFVVLAATDGCFGYLSTPMEFEGMLLETLLQASSPAQWEELLMSRIGKVAGDDFTLCLAAVGYEDFSHLQSACRRRYDALQREYLGSLTRIPMENRELRFALWQRYRGNYMRYMGEKQ